VARHPLGAGAYRLAGSYLVNFLHILQLIIKSFLTIMDNGNDPSALTPNSEFSDEKQKIVKQWPNRH